MMAVEARRQEQMRELEMAREAREKAAEERQKAEAQFAAAAEQRALAAVEHDKRAEERAVASAKLEEKADHRAHEANMREREAQDREKERDSREKNAEKRAEEAAAREAQRDRSTGRETVQIKWATIVMAVATVAYTVSTIWTAVRGSTSRVTTPATQSASFAPSALPYEHAAPPPAASATTLPITNAPPSARPALSP